MEVNEHITGNVGHRAKVANYMSDVISELAFRAATHDDSKFSEEEYGTFVESVPKLASLTYGSDEYKAECRKLGTALEHHYSVESHHPEFHGDKGVDGMTLMDLIEMICDWMAASKRHNDGDILKSIEINKGRHGLSEQLANILRNTVEQLEEL